VSRLTEWLLAGLWFAATTPVFAQSCSNCFVLPDWRTAESKPAALSVRPRDQDSGWLVPGADPENKLGWPLIKHLASDQSAFWTSPKELRKRSAAFSFAPFAVVTSALVASDSWLARQVPKRPDQLSRSNDFSRWTTYSLAGAAGASYLWGDLAGNDHLSETGFLAGEAMVDSTAVAFALKGISQRERPLEGNGHGAFFRGGNSFPSEHSMLAWSAAGVFAHQYPGPLTKVFAYGLASAVTLTRVTSNQHFASDAFVGSALGWYIGRQVYRAHHDPGLGGGPWGDVRQSYGEGPRNPDNMGSPYVPIDNWVYPAFNRLTALGYIKSAFVGQRPWTRMECARLLDEAEERLGSGAETHEAQSLYDELVLEFSEELHRLDGAANLGASVDSIYTRVSGISGPPLRDGYHFGQTIINDYGRPYGEGVNSITGLTAHAVGGPLSIELQGEYQHSPAIASDPSDVLQATARQDGTLPLPNGVSAIDRFRVLNVSVAVTFKNLQISFGKQRLELGPGDGGSLLMSTNAEPLLMLRIDQVSPVHIPGISRILGPVRTQFFLGEVSGQHWVFSDGKLFGPNLGTQPYIHGTKFSFKPTTNLEFGMGATVLFGGPDLPFTWHNFLRTFYANAVPGTASDAGDRRSTFDFSYRVPRLRDWLTIYADSLVEDEISPLGSTRPSMRLGMYFPKIPKIANLDLRLEGVYTDVPGQRNTGFIYANGRYRSGYTNNGQLLASWIGRQGRGGQGWATYWFSPRSKFEAAYRHAEVDKAFIGGGRLNDFRGGIDWMVQKNLAISGSIQYEQWKFPVLSATGQSNITASVQLTLYPNWRIHK
jgi:membrane-associated phospholipid phosphatase